MDPPRLMERAPRPTRSTGLTRQCTTCGAEAKPCCAGSLCQVGMCLPEADEREICYQRTGPLSRARRAKKNSGALQPTAFVRPWALPGCRDKAHIRRESTHGVGPPASLVRMRSYECR